MTDTDEHARTLATTPRRTLPGRATARHAEQPSQRIRIDEVARIVDILRTPFGFLFSRPQKEELVAEYVIREHHRGRALDEILLDAYVTNRFPGHQVDRLLDRPDILQAVGTDTVAAHRTSL